MTQQHSATRAITPTRVALRASRPSAALRATTLVAALTASGLAGAAPLPNAGRDVRITARDESLDRFLAEVFRVIDVPVVLSPRLAAQQDRKVNGDFAQPADMLLQDLARTYQFIAYFDGAVMHLVSPAELTSKIFPVGAGFATQVMAQAREMQMTDSRNTLRSSLNGQLVATGAPRFVQQVEELVRQARVGELAPAASVAVKQPAQDFRVFYLRYAWAQDTTVNFAGRQRVIPGVANILRALSELQPRTTGQWRPTPNTVPGLRNRDRDMYILPAGVGGFRDTPAMEVANALMDTSVVAESPAGADGGKGAPGPRIEADPRLNAIIVRDTTEQMAKYQRLIAALDVEPQSLEIEATIIDVDTDRMRELGINWRYNRGLNSVGFGRGDDRSLRGAPNDPSVADFFGGFASAIIGNRNPFVFRITALQEEGAARVVSNPQVVTLSNVEAVFDNSQTFYARVSGQYQGDLFNITAGTNLRVTPHVFKDESGATRFKLLTQIEDGSFDRQATVDSLPVVKRSAINTQALIAEGESLLIGGLTRDETGVSESKVPLLGDLPLLGHLFKTTEKRGARLERLFLITPRLVTSEATRKARERATVPLGELPAPPNPTPPMADPSASPAPAPVSQPAPAR
jgi:type III secretion protein C